MNYDKIVVPPHGEAITVNPDGTIHVPDRPIIPYIVGDGIGIDVTPAMLTVVNAAVEKAYGGRRAIEWMEVFAGERSLEVYGPGGWFPDDCATSRYGFACCGAGSDSRTGRTRRAVRRRSLRKRGGRQSRTHRRRSPATPASRSAADRRGVRGA